MNSFERLMNRMSGKPVDYLPNLGITMMFAAKEAGVTYGEFCSNYKALAKGALICHEKYGIDMVCAISDPMREAEGLGANVVITEDKVPFSPIKRIQKLRDIDTLKVIDPSKGRRMSDRIEAVRLLKETVKSDVPVIGWIEGAVAESCVLMDMQQFFLNLYDEPESMKHLMDICMEQNLAFAQAQVSAGADIIGMGDAASSLLGPSLFEQFALPYEQKMIRAIHEMGAKVKLHICGNINGVLKYVAKTGADIIDLDHMVDMEKAAQIFPSESSICGNFDPVNVVMFGTIDQIKQSVKGCMKIKEINNNIIAPGCEIPQDTDPRHLIAIHEAITEYS